MKISKRLLAISTLVDDDKKIIDVGCDHALLSIYLFKNKKNVKIIASDINEGPLKQAKENCEKYGADIEIKLGNGLDSIEEDINTIIISGMGGDTIIEILTRDREKLNNIDTIILSPQSEFYKVRKTVTKLGFYIKEEKLIEDGKMYLIIKLIRGNKKYSYNDLYFGPVLRNSKSKELSRYYENILKKEQGVYELIPKKRVVVRLKLKLEIKNLRKELQKKR